MAESIGAQIFCVCATILFCSLSAINVDRYVKVIKDSDDGYTLVIEKKDEEVTDEEVIKTFNNMLRGSDGDKENNQ